jgi:DNA-binding SARP family transcriptional activator
MIAPEIRQFGDPRDLVVRVLGPIEITGWVGDGPGGIAEELCCFLALHPESRWGTEALIGALWPLELELDVTPKTLRNHFSRLRNAVGAERLPDAKRGDGYRLEAATDWEAFRSWVKEADGLDGEDADRLRSAALSLVRGEPFAGLAPGRYSWAFSESLASAMTAAVVTCAERLSADRLAAGDAEGAEAAARAGLRASPTEAALWLAAGAALEVRGDPAGLGRLARDAERAAGPEVAGLLRSSFAVS